jgi:hypothetical protein
MSCGIQNFYYFRSNSESALKAYLRKVTNCGPGRASMTQLLMPDDCWRESRTPNADDTTVEGAIGHD